MDYDQIMVAALLGGIAGGLSYAIFLLANFLFKKFLPKLHISKAEGGLTSSKKAQLMIMVLIIILTKVFTSLYSVEGDNSNKENFVNTLNEIPLYKNIFKTIFDNYPEAQEELYQSFKKDSSKQTIIKKGNEIITRYYEKHYATASDEAILKAFTQQYITLHKLQSEPELCVKLFFGTPEPELCVKLFFGTPDPEFLSILAQLDIKSALEAKEMVILSSLQNPTHDNDGELEPLVQKFMQSFAKYGGQPSDMELMEDPTKFSPEAGCRIATVFTYSVIEMGNDGAKFFRLL